MCLVRLLRFTLIGFIFSVYTYNVFVQGNLLSKTFLTIFALIGFLFCVNPYVFIQGTLHCKAFLTIFTLIWFLFCVYASVFIERTLPYETFLTIFTQISDKVYLCLGCESVNAGSGDLFVQSISDNIRTDRVSLLCVCVCVY